MKPDTLLFNLCWEVSASFCLCIDSILYNVMNPIVNHSQYYHMGCKKHPEMVVMALWLSHWIYSKASHFYASMPFTSFPLLSVTRCCAVLPVARLSLVYRSIRSRAQFTWIKIITARFEGRSVGTPWFYNRNWWEFRVKRLELYKSGQPSWRSGWWFDILFMPINAIISSLKAKGSYQTSGEWLGEEIRDDHQVC